MSYILEGLKKLERKRQQDSNAPVSLSFDSGYTPEPKKRNIWPYVVAAILVLNMAFFLFWWTGTTKQSRTGLPEKTAATATTERKMSMSAQTTPAPVKEQPAAVSTQTVQPRRAEKDLKHTSNYPRQEADKTFNGSKAPITVSKAAPTPQTPAKSKLQGVGKDQVYNELPEESRKTLPELKMSLHYYSQDAKSRMARVNDKMVREGDTLADGLKVVEIVPNGVVLNFQGHRFLLGINE